MGIYGYLWDFMYIGKPKYSTGSWEIVGLNHQFNSDLRIKHGGVMGISWFNRKP